MKEKTPLAGHIKRRFLALKHYVQKNSLDAYRLWNPTPRYPFALDIYRQYAVLHLFEYMHYRMLKDIEDAVNSCQPIEAFFYKNRSKVKLNLPKLPTREIVIQEHGHKFLLNLSDYLDTGIFLDHRETRRWISQQSKNKIVLNTFAYTGAFSVYAGACGAKKTYSVDLSKTYCDWIKKNLELNGLSLQENWIYKMDTFEFLKYAKKKELRFDIIIIDPPTFSHNKGTSFSVQKDHALLLQLALERLNPKGFVLFSNNYRNFELDKKALRQCKIERRDFLPPDFSDTKIHQCFIISQPLIEVPSVKKVF